MYAYIRMYQRTVRTILAHLTYVHGHVHRENKIGRRVNFDAEREILHALVEGGISYARASFFLGSEGRNLVWNPTLPSTCTWYRYRGLGSATLDRESLKSVCNISFESVNEWSQWRFIRRSLRYSLHLIEVLEGPFSAFLIFEVSFPKGYSRKFDAISPRDTFQKLLQ